MLNRIPPPPLLSASVRVDLCADSDDRSSNPGLALRAKVMLLHELFYEPDDPGSPDGNFTYHANAVHQIVLTHTRHIWPDAVDNPVLTTSVTHKGDRLRDDELVINVSQAGEKFTPRFCMRIRIIGDCLEVVEFFRIPRATEVKLMSSARGLAARRRDVARRHIQKRSSSVLSRMCCRPPPVCGRTDTAILCEAATTAEVMYGLSMARCSVQEETPPAPSVVPAPPPEMPPPPLRLPTPSATDKPLPPTICRMNATLM